MRIHYLLYGVIAILLVLGGISPWIDGSLFKTNYLNLLAAISANTPVKIEVLDYQNGWFSSTAKMHLKSESKTAPFDVTVTQQITHGPFLFNPSTQAWTFAQAYIQNTFTTENPTLISQQDIDSMSMTMLAAFHGDLVSTFALPAATLHYSDNKLKLADLQGNLYLNASHQRINYIVLDLNASAIQLTGATTSITAKTVNTRSELIPQANNLWNVDYYLTTPQLLFESKKNDSISIAQFDGKMHVDNTDFQHTNHMNTIINMGEFELTSNEKTITIKSLLLQSDAEKQKNNLWNLKNQISLVNMETPSFEMNNLKGSIDVSNTDLSQINSAKANLNFGLNIENKNSSTEIPMIIYQGDMTQSLSHVLSLNNVILIPKVLVHTIDKVDFTATNSKENIAITFDVPHENLTMQVKSSNQATTIVNTDLALSCYNSTGQFDLNYKPSGVSIQHSVLIPQSTFITQGGASTKINNINFSHAWNIDPHNIANGTSQISFDNLSTDQLSIGPANIKFVVNAIKLPIYPEKGLSKPLDKNNIQTILTPRTLISEETLVKSSSGSMTSSGKIYWPNSTRPNANVNLRISIAMLNNLIAILSGNTQPVTTLKPAELAANKKALETEISKMSSNQELSAYSASQLLTAIEQNIPYGSYSAMIDAVLNAGDLSKEKAKSLKEQYAKIQGVSSDFGNAQFIAQQIGPKINDLLKTGYIKQDKDDYVMDISYQGGTLLINRSAAPAPVAASTDTTTDQAAN